MQVILAVDASTHPAHAHLVSVEGSRVRVVESHELWLGPVFARASEQAQTGNEAAAESMEGATPAPEASPASIESDEQSAAAFRDLFSKLSSEPSASLLIIPPHDYLSLNLQLPFKDTKSITRILALEVQDLVPFDVEEFLLEHHRIPSGSDNGKQDIHVSLVPRNYLRRVLATCRQGGFEPVVISTGASALAAAYQLAPEFQDNSALLYAAEPYYYLAMRIDGAVRHDRILDSHTLPPAIRADEIALRRALLTEIHLSIAATEERYQKKIAHVYAFGNTFHREEIERTLERPVTPSQFDALVENTTAASLSLAAVGAVLLDEASPVTSLTNFRTKEFAYRPQFKEVVRGLRSLAPYILGVALLAILLTILTYGLRAHRNDQLENEVRKQIRDALPAGVPIAPGDEMGSLQREIDTLRKELEAVGSQSGMSPLDILTQLSNDLAGVPQNFKEISIKGNKIELKGTAPDYATVDKIEKVLDSRRGVNGEKKMYCRTKKDSSKTMQRGSSELNFTFEIWLCD